MTWPLPSRRGLLTAGAATVGGLLLAGCDRLSNAPKFQSLLGSADMHGIKPVPYLRDLFCLLPHWNPDNILDLSPSRWAQTEKAPATQQILQANIFRQVALGLRHGARHVLPE